MRRTLVGLILAIAACVVLLVPSAAGASASARRGHEPSREHHHRAAKFRPVIFVHGFVGSGGQFETQAQRFTSNGYRSNLIQTQEYDSTFATETQNDLFTQLDQRIATLEQQTHSDKIDLVAHSLGTSLMQQYLSTPARAANVSHYVNVDGAPASAPPGGVPTLAVWARTHDALAITGALNVHLPDQTHVQSVTSAETFTAMYRFFNGHAPKTAAVVPEHGSIRLAGRAQIFPQNAGVDGATLQIYRIDARTGRRVHHRPDASFAIGADGNWGPFTARPGASYEFAIVRADARTHHFYFEPFVRSDSWIHLLTSPPTGGIGDLFTPSVRSMNVTIVRYKEFWGDQGANNDVLKIDGTNIINAANSPIAKQANAIAVEDLHDDGVSDLATPIPTFAGLPFFTGVDLFVPATSPPRQTVSLKLTPRGGRSVERISIPNWSSATDAVSVQFRDDGGTGGRCGY